MFEKKNVSLNVKDSRILYHWNPFRHFAQSDACIVLYLPIPSQNRLIFRILSNLLDRFRALHVRGYSLCIKKIEWRFRILTLPNCRAAHILLAVCEVKMSTDLGVVSKKILHPERSKTRRRRILL